MTTTKLTMPIVFTLHHYIDAVHRTPDKIYVNSEQNWSRKVYHRGTVHGVEFTLVLIKSFRATSVAEWYEYYGYDLDNALVMSTGVHVDWMPAGEPLHKLSIKQLIKPAIPLDMFYYMKGK